MIKRQELEEDELKTTAENELQELQQLQVSLHITLFMGPLLDSIVVSCCSLDEASRIMWRELALKKTQLKCSYVFYHFRN